MFAETILSWFHRDSRGSTLVVFAVATPMLFLASSAAVEYASLIHRRSQLQQAVDEGALAGANMLKLANADSVSVTNATRTDIAQRIKQRDGRQAIITVTVDDRRTSVTAAVQETVPSVTGRILGQPSTLIGVRAQAALMGSTRLCLLALDTAAKGALHLEKSAQLTASNCSIYVNSSSAQAIQGENKATVTSLMTCGVGGYTGQKANFSPMPQTGCPSLGDPLKDKPAPPVDAACAAVPTFAGPGKGKGKGGAASGANAVDATVTLDPGTYCGGLNIYGNANVMLRPGVYVIKDGPLIVDDKASVTGLDVGFYFMGDTAGVRFDKDTTINLTAPHDGAMAGLLMAEERAVAAPVPPPPGPKGPAPSPPGPAAKPLREYRIISDNARTMLGTIYLPAGRLIIDSSKPVADQSAYTIIVAQQIDLYDGPNLMLNANYGMTTIPVPDGVGPKSGTPALTQ